MVSFFSEDNVSSDEINKCYIFDYQSNESRAFRFLGTPGIEYFHTRAKPRGGGGSLPLEVVPDARESPSKKHPKRGFNGIYQKTP